MHGHLTVLQWARAQGCPWDEDTCIMAGTNGHLKVLQWAVIHGCPSEIIPDYIRLFLQDAKI